jgi:hypothetical protein
MILGMVNLLSKSPALTTTLPLHTLLYIDNRGMQGNPFFYKNATEEIRGEEE